MKPPDDRQLSINCEGLGLDLGLAPTNPQYIVINDLGICDKATQQLPHIYSYIVQLEYIIKQVFAGVWLRAMETEISAALWAIGPPEGL